MKTHRGRRAVKPDSAGLSWANPSGKEDAEQGLYVQGLPCTLYKTGGFNAEEHLIQWPVDTGALVDQYDGRLLLETLNPKQHRSWEDGSEDDELPESEMDEERFADLHTADESSLQHLAGWYNPEQGGKEAEDAASDAQQADLGSVPYLYEAQEAEQVQDQEAGRIEDMEGADAVEEPFQPWFEYPEGLNIPESKRLHRIISQTAKFVREAGKQSIFVLRVKQTGNPNFNFLMPTHALWPYFEWMLENGPPEEDVKPQEQEGPQLPSAIETDEMQDTGNALGMLSAYGSDTPKSEKEDTYFTEPTQNPESSSLDAADDSAQVPAPDARVQAIIEKLVAFVKKAGGRFEASVREKEKENPRFSFLQPSDQYYPYYRQQVIRAVGQTEADVFLPPVAPKPIKFTLASRLELAAAKDAPKQSSDRSEHDLPENKTAQHSGQSSVDAASRDPKVSETPSLQIAAKPHTLQGLSQKRLKPSIAPFSSDDQEAASAAEGIENPKGSGRARRPSRYFVPSSILASKTSDASPDSDDEEVSARQLGVVKHEDIPSAQQHAPSGATQQAQLPNHAEGPALQQQPVEATQESEETAGGVHATGRKHAQEVGKSPAVASEESKPSHESQQGVQLFHEEDVKAVSSSPSVPADESRDLVSRDTESQQEVAKQRELQQALRRQKFLKAQRLLQAKQNQGRIASNEVDAKSKGSILQHRNAFLEEEDIDAEAQPETTDLSSTMLATDITEVPSELSRVVADSHTVDAPHREVSGAQLRQDTASAEVPDNLDNRATDGPSLEGQNMVTDEPESNRNKASIETRSKERDPGRVSEPDRHKGRHKKHKRHRSRNSDNEHRSKKSRHKESRRSDRNASERDKHEVVQHPEELEARIRAMLRTQM